MGARIIHEDEEILVVHRPGRSEATLVTFATLTERPAGTWFWASKPAAALGLEAVGFVAKRENWYPASSMRSAARVVRPLLRRAALGYGFSMGGYAVLKYGRLLGLTHGVSLCPQVTIDPAEVPGDRRYHQYFRPGLHDGMKVAAGDPPPVTVVAGDPAWDLDGLHLRLAAEATGAFRLPFHFHQHSVIGRFASVEDLSNVVRMVLAGDLAALPAYFRDRKRHSAAAHVWVGRTAAARGHARFAEALWAKAATLGAAPATILHVRALGMRQRLLWLLARGRLDEALPVAPPTIQAQGTDAAGLVMIGTALLRRRQAALSAESFRAAIRARPAMPEAHLGLIEALQDGGTPDLVAAARQHAMACLGDDAAAIAAIAGAAT